MNAKSIYIVMRRRWSPIAVTPETPVRAYQTRKQANGELKRLLNCPATTRYDYWIQRVEWAA